MLDKENLINFSFLNKKNEIVTLDIHENPYGYRITIYDSNGAEVTLNALCKRHEEKQNGSKKKENWSKGDGMGKELYKHSGRELEYDGI